MTSHHGDKPGENDLASWVETTIREFCHSSPDNDMHYADHEPLTDEPIIGFSAGDDRLYEFFKQDIGFPYMTPRELFQSAFPDDQADSGDLTVISWILPLTKHTRDSYKQETLFAVSERWARAKHYGGIFNIALMKHLVEKLGNQGIRAMAPTFPPVWKRGVSEKYSIASSWSERHAAYVSGLGTFGLCEGLITKKGKAVRCGSILAKVTIPPTPRPYMDHHAWCLYFARGTCKLCIKRCPVEAITEQGHDKNRCEGYSFGVAQEYVRSQYHIDNYGCGLCQVGVPCESKNPVRSKIGDRITK